MKNNFFKILILIIFIIVFSSFYSKDYINFHSNKNNLINEQIELNNKIFNFDNLKKLNNTKLLYSPDENIIDLIINEIKNAKNKIYIEVYMLTETRIQNALKNAKLKNIDIKIILEKSPYKANNINNKAYNFLIKNNIDVIWSNPDNYSLNHTKLILIDDKAIFGTGNFTYSSFKYNREIFIYTLDQNIINNLYKIFINDYNWNKNIIYNDNIVLSPNYSRKKIEYMISNAQNNINMYFPYFDDKWLKKLLINKANNDINIKIIVDKKIENNQTYKDFINAWIKIIKLKKLKLHSKSILIDSKYLYIWSINFSTFSLDKNREIWIIIKNEDIIKKFETLFNKDLK